MTTSGRARDPITIDPVAGRHDLEQFIRFPATIHADDPHWVPTVLPQMRAELDPGRNPFYRTAERELFLARSADRVVGTVAAILDNAAADGPGERTGFFGFFEAIESQVVAAALIDAVRGWMIERGVARLRGPINGTPNDPSGVLVSGHKTRPSLWQGHTPGYYQHLIEGLGFSVHDELTAFEVDRVTVDGHAADLLAGMGRVAAWARSRAGVTVRHLDAAAWDREVAMAHRLYVDSHATIPGHRGMEADVFNRIARTLRQIMDPELALVVEVDGQPAGFSVTVPDLNEALQHTSGVLHPWDLLKLAWYRRRVRTASFKLIGILPSHRRRGLEAVLIEETANRLMAKGYQRVEMSLISSGNQEMSRILGRLGATPYRRYRMYQLDL